MSGKIRVLVGLPRPQTHSLTILGQYRDLGHDAEKHPTIEVLLNGYTPIPQDADALAETIANVIGAWCR